MKIARWTHEGTVGEGFVVEGRVVPFPDGGSVASTLAAGLVAARDAHARALESVDVDGIETKDVVLLPPVVATSIRDFV
ncbi:MAG: hydroxylase, partial [Microbacterium sp.]|nr:hydroxylase [Microbacterium sp.]